MGEKEEEEEEEKEVSAGKSGFLRLKYKWEKKIEKPRGEFAASEGGELERSGAEGEEGEGG